MRGFELVVGLGALVCAAGQCLRTAGRGGSVVDNWPFFQTGTRAGGIAASALFVLVAFAAFALGLWS